MSGPSSNTLVARKPRRKWAPPETVFKSVKTVQKCKFKFEGEPAQVTQCADILFAAYNINAVVTGADLEIIKMMSIAEGGTHYAKQSSLMGRLPRTDVWDIKDDTPRKLGTIIGNFNYCADDRFIYKYTDSHLFILGREALMPVVATLSVEDAVEHELTGFTCIVFCVDRSYAMVYVRSTDVCKRCTALGTDPEECCGHYLSVTHGIVSDIVICSTPYGAVFGYCAYVRIWSPNNPIDSYPVDKLLIRSSDSDEDRSQATTMKHGRLLTMEVSGFIGIIVIDLPNMKVYSTQLTVSPDDHLLFSFGLLYAVRKPMKHCLYREGQHFGVSGDVCELDKTCSVLMHIGGDRVAAIAGKKAAVYKFICEEP